MKIIAFVNLKGGSGKTITTAYCAYAYHRAGYNVLVVDADPQESATRWSRQAGWPMSLITLPAKDLHKRLGGIIPPSTDIVLIDTPPLEHHAGIVHSALRAADTAIVTMAPTMSEYERLTDVWAAMDEVAPLRKTPLVSALSMNRVNAQARSTKLFRRLVEESGHTVLQTAIPRREAYGMIHGAPIDNLLDYAILAEQVLALSASVPEEMVVSA